MNFDSLWRTKERGLYRLPGSIPGRGVFMNKKILSLIIGIISGFLIGIAITELLSDRIAFSLFIGIPAGIISTFLIYFFISKN